MLAALSKFPWWDVHYCENKNNWAADFLVSANYLLKPAANDHAALLTKRNKDKIKTHQEDNAPL